MRNAQWDWFVSTSNTRLEPNGKVVLLCTAWNSDDLIGRILDRREELGLRVRCITLQALREEDGSKDPLNRKEGEALWPERWPAEVLERRKKIAGIWWHSIYQGRPKGTGYNEWPAEYFQNLWLDDADWPTELPLLSASYLDPSLGKDAKKGDYAAIVWGAYHNRTLIIDSLIDRMPIPQLVRRWVEFNREHRPAITGVEGNAFQELLAPDYVEACRDVGYNADAPMLVYNGAPKRLRIRRLGKWFNAGLVKFRRTTSNELLVQMLKNFPNHDHDDGPDGLEGMIRLLCSRVEALAGMANVVESEIGA